MEKDLFNKVLQNYPSCSSEEAQELLTLKAKYPYSQLLHVLSARTSKDHSFSHQQNELQLAAVYSADRGVLKNMMTEDDNEPEIVNSASPVTPVAEVVAPGKRGSKPQPVSSPAANEPEDLAEKVIRDLTELYNTRHNFEMMFVDNPGADVVSSLSAEEQGKSKRERIIELSKARNSGQATETDEIKAGKRKKDKGKDIIDEIVNTKSEIEPESEKQKEQLEIIDQFIRTQPSISNTKDKAANPQEGDLSSIKTGEFGENIVSETLVELLLKQGKKDKAIEVLKKLVWKFPQKKAYFAAQIEELKK